jgi:hypothetical protein
LNKSGKPYNYSYILLFFVLALPVQLYLYRSKRFFDFLLIDYYIDNFSTFSHLRLIPLNYFSFSLGDYIYIIFSVIIIFNYWNKRIFYLTHKSAFLFELLAFISFVILFFQLSWGLNYEKEGLVSKWKIKKNYNELKLEKTISFLIDKSNDLHFKLAKNDSMKIVFPFNKEKVKIYLSNEKFFKVKSSLYSGILCYTGFSGYINPFTLEAQINEKIPMLSYITTIAHEQSHQIGIAAENEASYLAYKRTTSHKNDYIKYSGYIFALRNCLYALKKNNHKSGVRLSKKISPGIIKNINELNKFWQKYKNPFEPFFNYLYDKFLKINGQKNGILSYNDVVALIMFDVNDQMNKLK